MHRGEGPLTIRCVDGYATRLGKLTGSVVDGFLKKTDAPRSCPEWVQVV
jgi:hypothetical protein